MDCAFCGTAVHIEDKVRRADTCDQCGRDLRCCKQCKFYDPRAYNECREVSAERVVDKERSNFCDYFLFRGSAGHNVDKKKEAKKALDALFKK